MLSVAIICEGSTDYPVLRQVAEAVLQPEALTFREIQPDFDALRQGSRHALGPGWQGVRAFLALPTFRVATETSDIVVVQVDADIRSSAELAARVGSGDGQTGDLLEPLCDHVKSWAGVPLPESVIIVLPRERTETWLVAAHTRRKRVEEIEDPTAELVGAGVLDRSERGPEKRRARYARLAVPLSLLLTDGRALAKTLPELARFTSKLRGRVNGLKRKKS